MNVCEKHYLQWASQCIMDTNTWVVEHVELSIRKTNRTPMREFLLAPIKEITTLVLPLTFIDMLWLHGCHQIQKLCIYLNYDATPSLVFGQPI